MTHLRVHVRESVIGNDLRRVEILEFGCVRSGFPRQVNQQFGAVQIAVMIRSDVSDEIRRMAQSNDSVMKFDFHISSDLRKMWKSLLAYCGKRSLFAGILLITADFLWITLLVLCIKLV